MQKRWLCAVSLGLIAIMGGCTKGASNAEQKACNDRPDGEVYYCPADSVCCAGECVVEDDSNCGSCGNACLNGNVCKNSTCVCEATQSFCSN